MSQQPFSRPGAIDLSALKRPAAPAGGSPTPGAGDTSGVPGSSYAVQVTEENFQSTIEASMGAPVLLGFYSRARMPESATLANDLVELCAACEERFLVGLVDVDAVQAIAQVMQIPSIPLIVVIIDGRPMPLLQDVVSKEELRSALTQVLQQLTTQEITGRHQPRAA